MDLHFMSRTLTIACPKLVIFTFFLDNCRSCGILEVLNIISRPWANRSAVEAKEMMEVTEGSVAQGGVCNSLPFLQFVVPAIVV